MATSSAPFSTSRTSNWVAKQGGLPKYIRKIARALMERRGLPESRAIPLAIGTVKNWAEGKGDVNADTRAKAVAAYAEFRAKAAKSRATTATKKAVR